MNTEFVPKTFVVPLSYERDRYRLDMLAPAHADVDYDAVMSSRQRLRSVFSESTDWPRDTMTLEDNITDLKRHEAEFQNREAFAYTVLSPEKDKCLGCVYIMPCDSPNFDCAVYLWVRDDSLDLDSQLEADLKTWLQAQWPFGHVAFPGRDIPWAQWTSTKLVVS